MGWIQGLLCWKKKDRYQTNENKKQQKVAAKRERNTHRILLLGTGESGKSTFLRQMRLICGEHFEQSELIAYRDCIYDNVYKGVLFLLHACENLNIPWERCEESATVARSMQQHFRQMKSVLRERQKQQETLWQEEEFVHVVPWMKTLWRDDAMRRAFAQRSRILTDSFSENTEYFLNNIDRIGAPGYMPTEEDVVWSRQPTKDVHEVNLTYRGQHFLNFQDVGGQSVERIRWQQLTENSRLILFVVAASHYDEYYMDDASGTKVQRNKLAEAVNVLENLDAQQMLNADSTVILFLNKADVLEKKIANRVSNIRDHFPNFPSERDPFNIEHVKHFLVELLVASLRHVSRDHILKHFTTAVDRNNIDTVFKMVHQDALMRNIENLLMR